MDKKLLMVSVVFVTIASMKGSESMVLHTKAPVISTASIWLMVTEMQGILQKAHELMHDLSQSVVAIDGKEDELAALVDYVARESARRIDMVFDKAEEIRQKTGAQLQEVATYLKYVAVESSRQLQEVMERIGKVGSTVEYYLQGLEQTSTILGAFVSQVTDQATRMESVIHMMLENQGRIESALDMVRENSALAAQMAFSNYTYYTLLSSQIDVLSSDLEECCTELNANDAVVNAKLDSLAACCTELNENDAKIFSAIESINTAISMRSEKRRERNQGSIRANTPAQVHFISNNGAEEIRITEPGLYIVTEALATTGIVIQTHNVTLDLNGFTVAAVDDATIPLYIAESETVLVKNGTFVGGRGLVVTGSCGVTLEKLLVTNSTNHAIQMSGVRIGTLTACTLCNGARAGLVVDGGTLSVTCRDVHVSDCQGNGFDLQAEGIVLKECVAEHNGVHGIAISNSNNVHVHRAIVDNNKEHGILVESSVERVQVESCRVMGNRSIGCCDNGASYATWMNNLSSGNQEDEYKNIKAVAISKATSFWHNVYGN